MCDNMPNHPHFAMVSPTLAIAHGSQSSPAGPSLFAVFARALACPQGIHLGLGTPRSVAAAGVASYSTILSRRRDMAPPESPGQLPARLLNEYCGNGLMNVAIAFIVLSTVFVALRFISRFQIREAPSGSDDYLIIPAYLFELALCISGIGWCRLRCSHLA